MLRGLIVLLCCAAALTLLTGCPGEEPAQRGPAQAGERQPVAISLTRARTIPTERFVEVIGTLQGDEEVTVSAKVAGRITAIYADIGDQIQPGELLLEIDDTDYELVVKQRELAVREVLAKLGLQDHPPPDFDPAQVPSVVRAKLQADNAEAKFQRGKQLHEQVPPLISDQDFADFQTAAAVARSNYDVELLTARALLVDVSSSKAMLEIARQSLADAIIRVPQPRRSASNVASTQPILGMGDSYAVAERMVSVGEYVKDGMALIRLVDLDPVKLRATAPEKHVGRVRVGQKAQVSVDAYAAPFEGRVSRINPQIDPQARTFQVEIIVANPEHLLKPGSFGEALIVTTIDENAVFVPESAVITFAGVSKVFVIRNGKASEILVDLGQRKEGMVEVVKGLKGNEEIAGTGLNRLANGVPVTITPAAASTRPADTSAAAGGG